MAKYNWTLLKDEFITGNWLSIADFFRDKTIPNNSRTRTTARGWLDLKRGYQDKVISEVKQKVTESEIDVRLRQQKTAKLLQIKGIERLQKSEIDNTETARKMLVNGLEQERLALGMVKNVNATQVNINSIGKTEFDKLIDKADYEEILGMIAELKKYRERDEIVTA
jgi:hypothetical protein